MEALISAFRQRHRQPVNCLVMGATGAVGSRLLSLIIGCEAFDKVTVLTRRSTLDGLPAVPEGAKRPQVEVIQFDFDQPEKQASVFAGHSIMFCAHGTTRAQAGSAEAFRRIDYGHVMECAKLFQLQQKQQQQQQAHFLLVGAVGTSPNSWLLYPKTKGQLERDLHALQFPRLTILRPAMLLGRPKGRIAEDIGMKLVPMFEFIFPERVAVHCEQVAQAMLTSALVESPVPFAETSSDTLWKVRNEQGVVDVLENTAIIRLAKKYFPDWKSSG